jgi:diaminopropionate ammonia-lyase family
MFTLNPRAMRQAYPTELRQILSVAHAQQDREWLGHWDGINPQPTPLYHVPHLATQLGIADLAIKDEGVRSPLASFKALGAPIALIRYLHRQWQGECDIATLVRGGYRERVRAITVISATDGNHGRALAAAAQSIGCRCVIVIHAQVSDERAQAIAAYGAEVVRIAGNYDDSVVEAARMAQVNGWQVVSDTSYAGYEIIPADVMQGYSIIMDEAMTQVTQPFTHVFVQGGVGGLAAGVASYIWERDGAQRPVLVVVEPTQADCLYQSALTGAPANASGSVDSVMAGLACGETSPLAWRFLQPSIDAFLTVDDDAAVAAMRVLAEGRYGDMPMVAGESGVAGVAGVMAIAADAQLRHAVQLTAQSRVLCINTEGATAPSVYQDCVGVAASVVQARQAAWLAQR